MVPRGDLLVEAMELEGPRTCLAPDEPDPRRGDLLVAALGLGGLLVTALEIEGPRARHRNAWGNTGHRRRAGGARGGRGEGRR